MLDLSESRLLRELRSDIGKDVAEKEVSIAQGGLPDHGAYRFQCGIIRGMRDALVIAEGIEKRLNGNGER